MSRGSKPGRPRSLNREIKALIADYATKFRDKNREELAEELENLIEEKGYTPPSFETLKKYISDARKYEDSPLDKPWSLGSCSKYKEYFPLESMPILINLIKKYKDELNNETLSVRHAMWIVRLRPIIQNIFSEEWIDSYKNELESCGVEDNYTNEDISDEFTVLVADIYSYRERIGDILGETNFDTSVLDRRYFVDSESFGDFRKAVEDQLKIIYKGRIVYGTLESQSKEGEKK